MNKKSYKYRIYPNKEQEQFIRFTFGCVRFVYNHFLEDLIIAHDDLGEVRTYFQQCKDLTSLKYEHIWLREADSSALKYALRALNASYKNFYRGLGHSNNSGFPKFKRKKNGRKSYSSANNSNVIRINAESIHLPKIGYVKAKISRDIPQDHRIVSATISQEPSGKYYASILTEYEFEPPAVDLNTQNALGLDYSSPHFYVDSEGSSADMPHWNREAEERLAREQRKLSKMVRGSKNYQKQTIKVARAYEKVRFQRQDWQHKLSTQLADKYDYICIEDINMKDIARALHLAKATADNGFGQFREMLSYKMEERGKKLITIDKWFPSSKTCRHCGYVNSDLTLSDRTWICPSCGETVDRDINAAINIRNQGLAMSV